MQYLLLIYSDEKAFDAQSKAELTKMMGDYNQFSQDIKASGQLIGGNRLQSVTTATTVRVRDGKPHVTDGPFAETREQLGGYYWSRRRTSTRRRKLAARIPAHASARSKSPAA